MINLGIELPREAQERLEEEARRRGLPVQDCARDLLAERLHTLCTPEGQARGGQQERNQAAIALLDRWLTEPPDLEEAEGYPLQIESLTLREAPVE